MTLPVLDEKQAERQKIYRAALYACLEELAELTRERGRIEGELEALRYTLLAHEIRLRQACKESGEEVPAEIEQQLKEAHERQASSRKRK